MVSNKHKDRNFQQPISTRPVTVEHHAIPEVARRVPKGKQQPCPVCFTGDANGIGQTNGKYAKASTLFERYYECDRCGWTWKKTFRPEQEIPSSDE